MIGIRQSGLSAKASPCGHAQDAGMLSGVFLQSDDYCESRAADGVPCRRSYAHTAVSAERWQPRGKSLWQEGQLEAGKARRSVRSSLLSSDPLRHSSPFALPRFTPKLRERRRLFRRVVDRADWAVGRGQALNRVQTGRSAVSSAIAREWSEAHRG